MTAILASGNAQHTGLQCTHGLQPPTTRVLFTDDGHGDWVQRCRCFVQVETLPKGPAAATHARPAVNLPTASPAPSAPAAGKKAPPPIVLSSRTPTSAGTLPTRVQPAQPVVQQEPLHALPGVISETPSLKQPPVPAWMTKDAGPPLLSQPLSDKAWPSLAASLKLGKRPARSATRGMGPPPSKRC